MSSEPVVVFYKSLQCKHCMTLNAIWESSVVPTIRREFPNIRFFVLTTKDNSGKFDERTAPESLAFFTRWFPTILLVPGNVWNSAMAHLGPKNPVIVKEGVQIMNSKGTIDDYAYSQKYDIRNPEDFVNWLKEALSNPEFRRISAMGSSSGIQPPLVRNIELPHVFPPLFWFFS